MRLVTVSVADVDGDEDRVGVVRDGLVHLMPCGIRMLDLLGDDGERLRVAAGRTLREPHGVLSLAAASLRAPIPQPPTVRDFMTFEEHARGAAMLMGHRDLGPEWYEIPAFYFTNPYAVIGPYDDVPIPPGCRIFDFELEVAAIVGRPGRDLSVVEAEQYIAGYTILNDWSARDVQAHEMRLQLGPAKAKDTATTMGPALVTPDELEKHRRGMSLALDMRVSVNDIPVGEDSLSSMAWTFAELIAYASRGTWVRPGDVIGSGTCGGGSLAELWGRQGREAARPLQAGDVVSMSVDGLGTIRNRVVPGVRPKLIAARERPVAH